MSKKIFINCSMSVLLLTVTSFVKAQPAPVSPPNTAAANQVTIKREALNLISPDKYKVQLTIMPVKHVDIVATSDGVIESSNVKVGETLREQSEIIRIDNTRASIILRKAKADYEAGKIKVALAKDNKAGYQLEVVTEELKSLQAELDLAQLDFDRKSIRAPFEGRVNSLLVSKGQFVRFGQLLGTFGDNNHLMVAVPVDRSAVKEGDEINFKVEGVDAKGKIQVINPLDKEFEVLREIIASPASALVNIDNTGGTFRPGQSVFMDLIPAYPVTKVSNQTVANMPVTGERKIQVIREKTVRDIPVKIYAVVGPDATYVSGPFKEGDELITSSTIPLTDGTEVVPTVEQPVGAVPPGTPAGNNPAKKYDPYRNTD